MLLVSKSALTNFANVLYMQGTEGLPYYKYDLVGADWTARVVVVDSDCFLNAYQEVTSSIS